MKNPLKTISFTLQVRWNSSYTMIDRFISLRDLVEEIIYRRDIAGLTSAQKVKIRGLVMSPDDWDVLIALRDSLEPFKKVTTVLSGLYDEHYTYFQFFFKF